MSVETDIGDVTIICKDDQVPEGWRTLNFDEGSEIRDQLSKILDEWAIVRFGDHGKLDGSGYGNQLSKDAGSEAGQVFIVKC